MNELLPLDDLTYDELVEEARALIPTLAPGWTDHNPSDPGIVLIELFAWLTELLLYQMNQVPPASYRTFLELLTGQESTVGPESLDAALRETVLALRTPYRAVTCEDYQTLVAEQWPLDLETQTLSPPVRLRRLRCVAGVDLERGVAAAGHVSLVVVPDAKGQALPASPSAALLANVTQFLDKRRLLTTRHHVVGPRYVDISIHATLFLSQDVLPAQTLELAAKALARHFHPLLGGRDGQGWPFGHAVSVSEIYELLAAIPGVDFVGVAGESIPGAAANPGVTLDAGSGATRRTQITDAVPLHPYELPRLSDPTLGLQLMDYVRGQWTPV